MNYDVQRNNLELVDRVYQAIGKNDRRALLELLAPDVVISFAGASADVPWHHIVHGHAELPLFLDSVAQYLEFQTFEITGRAASASDVASRIRMRYRVRQTGRLVVQEQVHWWTIQARRVASLTHFEDTAQVIGAAAPL